MKNHRQGLLAKLGIRPNEIALIVAIIAIIGITLGLDANRSYWFQWDTNSIEIGRQTALLGIFALGAMMVIVSGGIDLSSGSMIAFSGTVIACSMIYLQNGPMSDYLFPVSVDVSGKSVRVDMANAGIFVQTLVVMVSIGMGLVSGFFVGTLHAWLITSVRLPPFVATLSTLVGLRSMARILCEYTTSNYQGSKKAQVNIDHPFFTWLRDSKHVYLWVAVFLVLAAFTWLILSRTVLGRHIYALGGNEQAARLSGIRTDRLKWFAYVFSAMTASLASVFYLANEGVCAPVNQGRGHELNAIAAAVVGGCSLQGGIGTVTGTLLGAMFLRIVIDSVSKIIKSGADIWEGLIVGIVVVLAVTFSQLQQLRGSGRRLFPGLLGACAMVTLSLFAGLIAMSTWGEKPAAMTMVSVLIALVVYGFTEKHKARG